LTSTTAHDKDTVQQLQDDERKQSTLQKNPMTIQTAKATSVKEILATEDIDILLTDVVFDSGRPFKMANGGYPISLQTYRKD
jgi:hypothetical protein